MKKADILKRSREASDIKTELVEVPEWGFVGHDAMKVKGLTGAQRDVFEKSCVMRVGGKTEFNAVNMRAKLVALCVIDDDGERVYSNDDVEWLTNKSASALARIYDVAARLSGISKEDAEELAKNFKSDQSDASTSDSL